MVVLEHINTLLSSTDVEARRKANEFLMKWQQSVEAWQETHTILGGGFPLEAKFIAAQTLRVKLMYDYYQLPQGSVGKLCEILMVYLADTSLPRNIASMISLAVCDLAIQAVEVWQSPLDSFLACYNSGALTLKTLLTLIECLADESRNPRIIVTPDIRRLVSENMKRDYGKLLDFLVKLRTAGNDVKTSSAIFRCWHSWRRLDNFAENSGACTIFINDCVEIVRRPNARSHDGVDDETYEAAVDCMVDVLQEITDLTTRIKSEAESSSDAVKYLAQTKCDLQHVLRTCFDLCVSDEFTNFLVEAFQNNRFLLECFSRLLFALIDALEFNLIDPEPQVLKLLKLAIHFIEVPYCLVFPGFKTADEPNTINCFSKYYDRMAVRDNTIHVLSTCDPGDFNVIDEETIAYAQYALTIISDILQAESPSCRGSQEIVAQLMEIILLVATRPAGTDSTNEYENYVDDVYSIVPKLVRTLKTDILFQTVQKCTISHGNFASSLQGLDSSFRAFGITVSALDGRALSQQHIATVSSIIEAIEKLLRGNMPTSILELNCWESAIKFLRYSTRVIMLDETGFLLQKVMGLLCGVYGAVLDSDAPYKTKIQGILVSSISAMCYYFRLGKLRNWEAVLQHLAVCIQRTATNDNLALMLIEGTARAISDLPPSTICNVVEQLAQGWLQQLEAVARNEVTMQPADLRKLLGKVCTLVRHIKTKNILHKLILEVVTPVMCRLLEIYHQDPHLVEDIGRCLKHSARSIGNGFAPCIYQVVTTVENIAKKRMWSTFLYLVEWLYLLTSPGQSEQAAVKQLYGILTGIALNALVSNNHQNQIGEDPEQLIDDFFGLQTRFIKNSPDCFDNEVAFREIIAASVMCFNIRQPHSVFEFWMSFLESDVIFARFKHVATEHLPKCVSEVFSVLSSGCETSVEHCVEDFVDALFHTMGSDAAIWLQVGLEKLPAAVVPNDRQKQHLLEALVSGKRQETIYQIYKLCCQVAMRNRAC